MGASFPPSAFSQGPHGTAALSAPSLWLPLTAQTPNFWHQSYCLSPPHPTPPLYSPASQKAVHSPGFMLLNILHFSPVVHWSTSPTRLWIPQIGYCLSHPKVPSRQTRNHPHTRLWLEVLAALLGPRPWTCCAISPESPGSGRFPVGIRSGPQICPAALLHLYPQAEPVGFQSQGYHGEERWQPQRPARGPSPITDQAIGPDGQLRVTVRGPCRISFCPCVCPEVSGTVIPVKVKGSFVSRGE